jgi:Capsular polysaccharide synthesis protein
VGGVLPVADVAIPKTIWFVWFQGVENAPEVVRACHDSWLSRNPGWDVVTLDESSLFTVASLDYTCGKLATQLPNHRSNVLRLELLSRYGGVWADATCFCVQALDDWLPGVAGSGFFAFAQPGPDRPLSSWFLAASPANLLVVRWLERMGAYWCDHVFRDNAWLRDRLGRHLTSSSRRRALWFSPLVRDVLRVAPYFAFHYGFEKLLAEDPRAADIWERTPTVSADGPHRPQREGLLAPISPSLRDEVDGKTVPVYKLSWKLGDAIVPPNSALAYILGSLRR